MAALVTNIRKLVNVLDTSPILRGAELAILPCIDDAYLIAENKRIAAFGPMCELTLSTKDFGTHFDASSHLMLPY